ncbi:hypothetical protein LPJ64_003937, partial [Coemansia asiatica]
MSSGFGATNGIDPSSANADGGGNAGGGSADDFLNFQNTMFMGNEANMDEMWGIGGGDAAANIFFNMDAFSSAPSTTTADIAASAAAGQPQNNMDLASLGFDMGASVDPEAWKMLLQGDPSMDDIFGGFGQQPLASSVDTQVLGVSTAANPAVSQPLGQSQMPGQQHQGGVSLAGGTLAPSDLDALRNPAAAAAAAASITAPPSVTTATAAGASSSVAAAAAAAVSLPRPIKSPTPSATTKKTRQTKPKKPAAPKGEKASKAKAKKAATPKLKSPTPQITDPTANNSSNNSPLASNVTTAISPSAESVRKIRPKADSSAGAAAVGASPTPSVKSVQHQAAPSATPTANLANVNVVSSAGQPFSMTSGSMGLGGASNAVAGIQNTISVSGPATSMFQVSQQSQLQQQAQQNAFLAQQQQAQQAFMLQQQQQQQAQQQQQQLQNFTLQNFVHMNPLQRAQFIQHLQINGGTASHPLI